MGKSDQNRYSLITDSFDKCFICGLSCKCHLHEIFFGSANRKKSIEDGMVVPLCPTHHNMSGVGVHFNHKLDMYLKTFGQKVWMEHYTNEDDTQEEKIEKFIERYGRNYLEDY